MSEWRPGIRTQSSISEMVDTMLQSLAYLLHIDEIIPSCEVINMDPYAVGAYPRYIKVRIHEYYQDVYCPSAVTFGVADLISVVHFREGDRYEVMTGSGGGGADLDGYIMFICESGDLQPTLTNGCAALAQWETTVFQNNYFTLDFDDTNQEWADGGKIFPGDYDGGAIKARFYWTAASGSGSVKWRIYVGGYTDDDALDGVGATPAAISDTLLAAEDLHITTWTAEFTPNGNPGPLEWLQIKVSRQIDEDPTLNADARLLGVLIHYTKS